MLLTEKKLRLLIRNLLIENEDGLLTPDDKLDYEAVASLKGEKEYEFDGEKFKVKISVKDAKKRLKDKIILKKDEIGLGGISAIIGVASGIIALKDQIFKK